VATGKLTKVDKSEYENVDVSLENKLISDFAWSPDSRHIAYTKMDADLVYKIYIHSLQDGKNRCVSLGIFNDFSPVFTPDGAHLLFISNRRFSPTLCDFEWEMVYKKVAGVYALTLRKDGQPFLPFQSDEEEGKKPAKTEEKKEAKTPSVPRVAIDFQGIADRVQPLPLPRGNYRSLSVNGEAVYYLNSEEGDYNRFEYRALGPRDLHAFSLEKRKTEPVIKGISGYKLSADGSTIVYRKGDAMGIIELSDEDAKGTPLDLKDLQFQIEPLKEWRQIFNEAWRMERDFYYEPNMHGQDWQAMKEKYGRLLDSASCRQDIRFIVGELIGELNTSHTYVYGGDRHRQPERHSIGLLGVDWEVDTAANLYRFKKIYRTAEWTNSQMPPLAGPGVSVADGDYLLAINGVAATADRNIYSYFQNLAGRQITLLVNHKPDAAGAKKIKVKPVGSEYTLRYQDWLERNRRLVEEKSGGRIGYIHLPDTYMGSAREFPKYFYSQTRKQGLIIDGRFNGGGLDPDIFLQRLNKRIHSYWTRRHSHDQTSPALATRAHMVLLTNRQAGSGGDELPQVFQFHKMGPVIGTRTWGGLVGVSMFISMIDGGGLTAPDYRIYNGDGKWIIENYGVKPDIEVDQTVAEMARGYDAQLMTGIEYLLKKIKTEPRPWPTHEPFPVDK
jgi:tricorn protease